jgi:soluble lytic murein transglycosylase-like protein
VGRIFTEADFDDSKLPEAAPQTTPGRLAAGGLLNIFNSLAGGFGDEVTAGGAARLNQLKRAFTDEPGSYEADYDKHLGLSRQLRQEFRNQSPAGALFQDVAGGVLLPLGKLSTAGGILKNALRGGARAATVGGVYGFGEGEGGIGNRLENAKDSALVSGLLGGALSGGAKAVEKVARNVSNRAGNAASETMEKGLGVQYGDRVKGLNRVNLFIDDAGDLVPYEQAGEAAAIQAPIQRQIAALKDSGVFKNAPDDVGALKIHLTGKAKEIGRTIGALSKEADEVVGAKEIQPILEKTDEFINGYRGTVRDNLKGKIDEILEDYAKEPGSGFSKLTKFLDKLQKETTFDTATPKEVTQLKRFISFDLRKTAENIFDEVLPEKAGAYAKANELYSGIAAVGKTLNKPLARQTPKLGDYVKGGSLPMTVVTGAASLPLGLGPAAAVTGTSMAAGAVKKYLEAARPMSTSRGYEKLARAAGDLANKSEKALPVAQKLGVSIAPSLAQGPQDESQEAALVGGESRGVSPQQQKTGSQDRRQSSSAAPKKRRVFSEEDFDPIPQGELPPETSQRGKSIRDISAITSNLSPFIQAVIEVESSGKPNARSPKGARGLMQIMPEHYKRLGITDPEDAAQSIKGGTQILQEELERFGDPKLALAAYNAGSPRVIKAISKAGSDSFERIYPYLPKETQQYVAKVLAAYKKRAQSQEI